MSLNIAPLAQFANERHAIFLRKSALEGKVPPPQYAPVPLVEPGKTWRLDYLTDDPVLGGTRFTNIARELDTVTIWINDNIRVPFAGHEALWFMIAIGRLFNWPPTLEMLMNTPGAWPSHPGFSLENVTTALGKWKAAGKKCETGAFMTRAENQPGRTWSDWPKHKYLSEIVLGRLWAERDLFQHLFRYQQPSVVRVWEWIKGHYGWGAFLSGQVTTDMCHTRYLSQATDRDTWAALGPGSTKGLNLLHGRPIKAAMTQGEGLAELREIQKLLPQYLAPWVPKQLALPDVQNLCCEISKYLPLKDGSRDKSKVKYVPGRGY